MDTIQNTYWITLTREEPVNPSQRIIDAHHHLWGEGKGIAGAPASRR